MSRRRTDGLDNIGAVHPRTEELLNLLLWSAEQLAQPTFRNLSGSFESWAYRNGIHRQVARLEKRRLVERQDAGSDTRLYRLTEQGRLHALGGRDPMRQWTRPWDGNWRLVLFDVPVGQDARRMKLRRALRSWGFGYLQNSVWITPDPLDDEIEALRGAKVDVESLILLEARPCAGESDAEIAAGAWDFDRINRQYSRCLEVLNAKPNGTLKRRGAAGDLRRWAAAERQSWKEAVRADPLLPRQLLPSDYLGEKVWSRRIKILGQAGREMVRIDSKKAGAAR